MFLKLIKFIILIGGIVSLVLAAVAGVAGYFLYTDLTRDLPKIESIADYTPKAVTEILSDDGTLMAEVFDERRYLVDLEKVPVLVRNAFLAAEDANFYEHPGIDFVSILRAVIMNLRKKTSSQGASTITQQVVKSLLLTPEKTYRRKAREAILSYQLESALSKDEILEIYLNQIFLGSNAYGIKAAAQVYFQKELEQLTLPEAAFLAGLPQRPSVLGSERGKKLALARQHYVLGQMFANQMITREEYDKALATGIPYNRESLKVIHKAPYFSTHAMKGLDEILAKVAPGLDARTPGGFRVFTTGNVAANDIAEKSVRRALEELDKRRGWRGAKATQVSEEAFRRDYIQDESDTGIIPTLVTGFDLKSGVAEVVLGSETMKVNLAEAKWANTLLIEAKKPGERDKFLGSNLLRSIHVGDVIEIKKVEDKYQLSQTPNAQGAFVLINPRTGEVKALVGGYSYRQSVFNRATQALRQPGSSFKPFIYLTALDDLNYTASTMVPDSPIHLRAGNGQIWSPSNYDHKYLGPMTLRTALQRSRNVVSVHLIRRLGVDSVIETARRFGLTTPIPRELSIALGTPEVYPLEMARAYGVFAAEGKLVGEQIIKRIEDRKGNLIYEHVPTIKQVISPQTAFLMAHLMQGVVERGTAQLIKQLGHPVGGKTGTTNDQMDAWFDGYTPEWVGISWVGFDVKKNIGRFETGGKAAAPIFLYTMQELLKGHEPVHFAPPPGVVPVPVDLATGRPMDGGFIEYFRVGNEPGGSAESLAQEQQVSQSYLTGDEF